MKYILHDTNAMSDEKLSELFMQFGYEGIGLFWALMEKIGNQEKPIKTAVLKHQLGVGKKLEKCWQFMEEIDLISSTNDESFNERILSYSEKYEIKKEKTRNRVAKFRENQQNKEIVTRYGHISNASKVKESKVKENNSVTRGSPNGEQNRGSYFLDESSKTAVRLTDGSTQELGERQLKLAKEGSLKPEEILEGEIF